MSACVACGQTFDDSSIFCAVCGIPLQAVTGTTKQAYSFSAAGSTIYLSQIVASVIALAALSMQLFSSSEILVQAFLCCVVFGCAIVVARFGFTVRLGNRFAEALIKGKEHARHGGKFSRWIIRPAYGISNGVTELTKRISDPFVKNGMRASLWFLVGSIVVCALIYVTLIIVAIILALLFLWLTLWFMSLYFGNSSGSSMRVKRIPEFSRAGDRFRIQKVNNKSHLVKKGLVDIDIGELQRRNYKTEDIHNIFGPNIRVVENINFTGGQNHDRPYRIENLDGEHLGDLVRPMLGDDLMFEPADQD